MAALVLGLRLGIAATPAPAATPVLHERIAPNADDDRRSGAGRASANAREPNAREGVTANEAPPGGAPSDARDPLKDAAPGATFEPDRDTRRPDVLPYEDPFVPSTAPFKRLLAFDTVDANYTLSVQDGRLRSVPLKGAPAEDGSDETFHASLAITLSKGHRARLPTAGAGARVLRARATRAGTDERVPFRIVRDGADNWFAEGSAAAPTPARLELDLAVPHAAFGWGLSDPGWSDLPPAPRLPGNAVRAARTVAAHLGASQALTPRENVKKLVDYFRSFEDADDPPPASSDIYLDLALSRKGVCRHRAFAFMVTALGLGIPTRMVANEAHAWVEVNDGAAFRRIDLGGAGRALRTAPEAAANRPPGPAAHLTPPPDPFGWPPHASRGEALAEGLPEAAARGGSARTTSDAVSRPGDVDDPLDAESSPAGGDLNEGRSNPDLEGRPPATVSITLEPSNAPADARGERRGKPIRVHGTVRAGGDLCPNLLVNVLLAPLTAAPGARSGGEVALGALATGPRGEYQGDLVVPARAPLGDYALVARTSGDAHCGPSPALLSKPSPP